MGQAIGEMLMLAVAVAISPVPIIAVVLLLAGPGGKVKGVAYVVGSALSTAIVGGVLVAVGVGSTAGEDGPSTSSSVLKLVLGVVLLGLAVKQWRGRPLAGEDAVTPGWMGALDGFTPVKALAAGVVLNVFNPKNLLFILAGAAAVAGAGASGTQEAAAWAVFCVIATIGVATPVGIALAMGDGSSMLLDRLKSWMARNSGVIMAVILLLIGTKLVGDGIAGI